MILNINNIIDNNNLFFILKYVRVFSSALISPLIFLPPLILFFPYSYTFIVRICSDISYIHIKAHTFISPLIWNKNYNKLTIHT